MIIMWQCRFIQCNKCTPLVKDLDSWGDSLCVSQGVFEKSLYLLLNFAVNLKPLSKIKGETNKDEVTV